MLGALRPPEATGLSLRLITTPGFRRLADEACGALHHAGACRRVGRRLVLAIDCDGEWAGAMVLGSTFPAIAVRDEAFGLDVYARGWKQRGLVSAWASENREYWDRLQLIVNHARTFVFPSFAGQGIGIAAHSLLLSEGRRIWEEHYRHEIAGFDNLCDTPRSRLFAANRWVLVGQTKGYSRDPHEQLSRRLSHGCGRDNAGLTTRAGATRWWVWTHVFTSFS